MIAILILVEMSTGVCWLGITYDTIIDIFVLGNTYHTEVVCHKTFYNHKWFVVNIFSHHLLCIFMFYYLNSGIVCSLHTLSNTEMLLGTTFRNKICTYTIVWS